MKYLVIDNETDCQRIVNADSHTEALYNLSLHERYIRQVNEGTYTIKAYRDGKVVRRLEFDNDHEALLGYNRLKGSTLWIRLYIHNHDSSTILCEQGTISHEPV